MLTQTKLKGFKCDQTPLSNTGSNSQVLQDSSLSVRVDWLQGTIRFRTLEQLHEVISFIEGYTKEKYVMQPERGRFLGKQWHNSAQGIEGCLILYNLPSQESDEIGHAFISFTATILAGIDVRDVWRIAFGLVNCWSFKATRFDIAIDDFSRAITYEMIDAALGAGNFTGFRKSTSRRNRNSKGKFDGFTHTFGGRGSNWMGRFYDKDAESKGRIKSHRLEGEAHDELAQKMLADWLKLEPEEFEETSPVVLAGMVIGRIEFVHRTTDKNISRAKPLDWWQAFKNRVGASIRHSIETVATSYERKRKWIERQVSVTLAMFKKVMGNGAFKQYLSGLLADGQERFTSYNEAFIDAHGRGNAEIEFDWHVCND